jgi:hypothetical protein
MAVEGDLEEMARKELGGSKKTSCGISSDNEAVIKSIVRIQLVKTEYPSACVRVNYKPYRSAIALYYL